MAGIVACLLTSFVLLPALLQVFVVDTTSLRKQYGRVWEEMISFRHGR